VYKGDRAIRATGTGEGKVRGETINLRASQVQKSLIDRAAAALGRNRSDFMLESACREAAAVLLDRRYFTLPAGDFKRFTAMLDRPPADTSKLRRLLKTKAPWER
jgi:uncharacterized protein (DUF1778 family)